MIKYYGVFQLVDVVKTAKTKAGDTVAYFTCASRRSKEVSDFKLFKAYGKNAERLLDNLEKNDSSKKTKFKSRKLFIEGYVETYQEIVDVECKASLKPENIPATAGKLTKSLSITALEEITIERDSYVVNHFEFLDSNGTKKSKKVIRSSQDEDEDSETIILGKSDKYNSDDEYEETAATKSNKKYKQHNTARDNVKSNSSKSYKDLEETEKNLSSVNTSFLGEFARKTFEGYEDFDSFAGSEGE